MERESEYGRHHVKSLAKGLAVIRSFGTDNPQRTLSDVARATGLDRAASRRILLTLEDLGYVRSDGREFMLTPRVLELGYAFLSSLSIADIAQPHLERLSSELTESSSMSVLDGAEIVYICRVAASRIFAVALGVGARLPAHVTSMGRILLAAQPDEKLEALIGGFAYHPYTRRTIVTPNELREELLRVRRQRWAIVDQELEEGLRSVAAPIHGPNGDVVAAMNVSAHAARTSLSSMQELLLPALLDAAVAIENDLASGTGASAVQPSVSP